jgi:hypothetical protein
LARKQAMTAVQPLPPGAAIQEPATNLFPHAQKLTPWPAATPHEVGLNVPPPPEPIPVATVQPATNAPPAPTEQPIVAGQPVGPEPANYTYFETALAPYGTWFNVDGYGRCWRPTVAVLNASWRPYADHGRWLWSDCGWYWYSDYTWGWAPFHYGRWHHTAHHGWHWVPGTHWGPSWVTWRYTDGYCGWAPLPPTAYYHHGHGFYHNTVSVGLHYGYGLADYHYTYVPFNRFCDRAPYHYYLPRSHAYAVHKHSTVVNNYVSGDNNTIINHGVGFEKVAKVTRGDVRKVAIRDAAEPRNLAVRRERLGPDGQTLTVARTPIPPTSVVRKAPPTGGDASPAKGTVVYPGAAAAVQKGGAASVSPGASSAGARVVPMRDAASTVRKEIPAAKSASAPPATTPAAPASVAAGNAGAYTKPAGRVAEYQARRAQPNPTAPATPAIAKPVSPTPGTAPSSQAADHPKGSIVMRGRQGASSSVAAPTKPLPSWAVPSPAVASPAPPSTRPSGAAPAVSATKVTPGAPATVGRVPAGPGRVESYQGYRSQPLPSAGRRENRAYTPPSAPPSATAVSRAPSSSPTPAPAPSYHPGQPAAPRVQSVAPAPVPSGSPARAQGYRGSGGYSRGFN